VIDEVIGKGRAELLWPIALVVLGATAVQAGTGFALSQVLGVAAQKAINDLRKQLQAHATVLPIRYFNQTQTGVLISRIMTDAEGVRNLIGTGLVQLIGGLITAVLALGVLLWLHWQLTLIVVGILAVFGVVLAVAFRYLRPLFRHRREINARVTGRLTESMAGIRIVKAYTAEEREQLVFSTGVDELFDNVRRTITGASGMSAVSTAVVGIIGAVMIVMGGSAMLSEHLSIGDFIMYVLFTGLLAAPVVQIASIGTQISEAFAGLDRIREVMQMATERDEDARREPCGPVDGAVSFRGVAFEYQPGRAVLSDVTFDAPAGSTTALVGSSGAGKSTLASLVMAFHQPTAGTITVDGRDLSRLRLGDYRSHLGVVLQDDFLFDGTVAENIRFSTPGATIEQVHEAAKLANAYDFIAAMDKGFETIIGERGVRLSGGQRQRLAIARALLADPRILILDEATSSLDSESEAKIQQALARLRRGRTTFVIAHRLSTIRSADQILVIEEGRVVERGTHEELYELGGRYRSLHDRQNRYERELYVNPGEELAVESE
jgi:subfamily B ATP-binding cassette protein MsbA